MFSSDRLVSHTLDAPLADETVCEQLAKAAIDYATDVLKVDPEGVPTSWQSSYLCVIEDAIIHHIDWALETQTSVSELEQTLKQFIDQLGTIFHSSQAQPTTSPEAVVH